MELHLDLENDLRRVVREEIIRAREGHESDAGWLDVAGAADHLALSQESVRGLVKRRAIPFTKMPNGRIRFERRALDVWARGGDAS